MGLEAKVISITEKIGQSAKGQWTSQQIIVETFGQFPKSVALKNFNNKVQNIEVGRIYNFEYNLESREYNGNWFTDVNIWKATADSTQPQSNEYKHDNPTCDNSQTMPLAQMTEPTDDVLPF